MPYQATIRQLAPVGILNLRANERALGLLNSALGFGLPLEPNTTATNGGLQACCMGPDEWLLLMDDPETPSLATSLRGALSGEHAAVTVVSDAFEGFEVAGQDARDVLDQGTSIDTHPDAFRPGACERVRFAKLHAILLCLKAQAPRYWIFVPRSYANYFRTWLVQAGGPQTRIEG